MDAANPALCPRCGALLQVFQSDAGLYLGCDEPFCGWMSEPIDLAPGEVVAVVDAVVDETRSTRDAERAW